MRQVYFTRHGSRVHVAVHAKTVNTNIMVFVVVVVDVVTVLLYMNSVYFGVQCLSSLQNLDPAKQTNKQTKRKQTNK